MNSEFPRLPHTPPLATLPTAVLHLGGIPHITTETPMPEILLETLTELKLAEGIHARIVTADTMTIAHVRLAKGANLPEHKHVHEQVVNVVDGELELIAEGKPHRLTRGKVFVLPSNIPHAARAISDCYVIDVFHPVREDFRVASFPGYSAK